MNVYEASVTISLVDKVSGALGLVARQLATTDTAAAALNSRLTMISGHFKNGMTLLGGGLALATPLAYATKQAMSLQDAMTRVKVATHASNEQMKTLDQTITKTANATGIFSKGKLAGLAADIYSSGIRDVNQINSMLPTIAKASEQMQLISGGKLSASQSTHSLIALAHQFGSYEPEPMKKMIEAAVALAPSLPGGVSTLTKMGSFINVLSNRNLGISPEQSMAMAAAVAQTSGGSGTGRGGLSAANVSAFLKRSMPGLFGAGLLSGKAAFAAAVMGLGDKYGAATSFKNGSFDIGSLQKKLHEFEGLTTVQIARRMLTNVSMLGKKAEDELPLIHRALDTNGKGVDKRQLIAQMMTYQYGSASGVAQLFGDDKFTGVLNTVSKAVKSFPGIEKMQEQLSETLSFQLERLGTNFQTLASTIGSQLIPVVTPLVKKLGDFMDGLNTFAIMHPRLMKAGIAITVAASGLLIFGGVAQIAKSAFMGLAFMGPMLARLVPGLAGLGAQAGMLARVAMVARAALGPLGLALMALTLNWDNVTKFVRQHSDFFIHILAEVDRGILFITRSFQRFGIQIGYVADVIGSYLGQKFAGPLADLGAAMTQGMTVSKDQAIRDRLLLQGTGMGGAVSMIKGYEVKPQKLENLGVVRTAPNVTMHTKLEQNFHVPPGTSPDGLAKEVRKQVKQAIEDSQIRTTKRLGYALSGSSGNSVGRSINQHGATRP